MKNLLFVDDEIHLTSLIISGLKNLLRPLDYNFFSTQNGQEALQVLEKEQINFVVTDLKMPVMNGLELLAYLHSNFPSIPIIVLNSYSSNGIEERLRKLGCLKLIPKPVNIVQLAGAIKELMNETKVGGVIQNISVGELFQLIEMEGRNCQVKVINKVSLITGWFQFENGILYDSGCCDIRGEPAAQKIIGWDEVEITITYHEMQKKRSKRRITSRLMTLLLNSMHQKDEASEASQCLSLNSHTKETKNHKSTNFLEKDQISPDKKIQHNNIIIRKEPNMNVQKPNKIIGSMVKDLDDGLLATDIWTIADGFSIAGHNSQPKANALFNQLTSYLNDTLTGSGFPGLGKYYMMDLLDNKLVIILPMGEYRWGVLVDSSKIQLGLLLNVIVPKIIDAFEEAITN